MRFSEDEDEDVVVDSAGAVVVVVESLIKVGSFSFDPVDFLGVDFEEEDAGSEDEEDDEDAVVVDSAGAVVVVVESLIKVGSFVSRCFFDLRF